MDSLSSQSFSSRQGLSFDFVSFPVLISSMSICTLFVSTIFMSLVLFGFVGLLVSASIEEEQWNNKTAFCYSLCWMFMGTYCVSRFVYI